METISSEREAKDALQSIIDGMYDFNVNALEALLDVCADCLEKCGVFEKYDLDQNSLLHRATDHLTKLIMKKASE